ncbi:BRO-N domain-containing protein [Kordia jejudonensis]|uniref:BRO-N domain-containing protein n=1 Tax=Kordia jejudonensis TaxID=1348245 RepID=UPI0009E5DEF6|nr:BRO family protein [Kordia jejudonensis]
MQLQIFKYNDNEETFGNLTTIDIEGEAWFVAKEVCDLLGIGNPSQAVSTLDDDEKNTIIINDGTSGNPNKTIISESGLYALIFKSKKPSAKKFRKWVTKEVIPAIRKTGGFGINRLETPNFVVRFNDNWSNTDKGYFSVISELFVRLYGRFEQIGYTIPNKAFNGKEMRPDGSVGKTFANYLRKHHPDLANDFKKYPHHFPSGLVVDARQYKNELLPIFIKFIDEVWIPERATKYFKDRDPIALDYLPKLLGK